MNDLETRIRGALQEDAAWRSVDALLDDVRRGARRRRARRTTSVAAAAALVVAVAGGGLAWHRRELRAADHSQGPDHLSGAMAVSVSASGTVFKVVGNQDCTLPCSVIWKHTGSAGWTRLATFHEESETTRFFGPLMALEMAPNGRDGWTWGPTHVWSTHDGGRTWSRVTSPPFGQTDPRDDLNLDLVPGSTYTYAAVQPQGHSALWRSPTGSDRWTRVRFPQHAQGNIAEVLPDSRVVIPILVGTLDDDMRRVRRHGRVVRLIEQFDVGDGTAPWRRAQVPCLTVALPTATRKASLCGPGGRRQLGGALIGPATTDGTPRYRDLSFSLGTTGSDAQDPVGHQTQLHVTAGAAYLVTPSGTFPVRLRIDNLSRVYDRATQGPHSVFIAGNHRIYATDDGGRHWHELP